MTAKVAFDVDGAPVGQAALRHSAKGHAYYANAADLRPWKATLAAGAAAAMAGRPPLAGALAVRVTFRLGRPRSHYRVNGSLRPTAPVWPDRRPDLDHLVRSLDALTGSVWADDNQLVRIDARKVYGVPGASVEVLEWVE